MTLAFRVDAACSAATANSAGFGSWPPSRPPSRKRSAHSRMVLGTPGLAGGLLLRAVLRARGAGHAGQAGEDGVPELVLQRLAHIGGNGVQALLAGGVPGTDQAAQRPLRLLGPDRAGVALGAVLVVPQQVRQACLVPGDVLPPGMKIV